MATYLNQTLFPPIGRAYWAPMWEDGFPRSTTSFLVGVSLHLCLFCRGEWDIAAFKISMGFIALQVLLFAYYRFLASPELSLIVASCMVAQISSSLVAGVSTSMLIYRAFFHRLNSFPGPFSARLSIWYITGLYAKHPDAFNAIRGLHNKYGDFVRTGPTELSINHPDAVQTIHSGLSQCTKGPWYSMLHPFISLFAIRDKAEHARRRKPWELAFRPRAVLEYLPALEKSTNELLAQIDRRQGTPTDITYWINLFTFDLTGRIAFSQEYNCIRDNKRHPIMEVNDSSNVVTGILSQAVWVISFIKKIPILNKNMKTLVGFSELQVENREKMKSLTQRDVFSWLWEDFKLQGLDTPQSRLDLAADASLVIFAGSGTVAVTIIGVLYFLVTESPHHLEIIQREIDGCRGTNAPSLGQLSHLNAVINESLRLHYPALSGFQRQTPPGGIRVGDTYIPGNVNIKTPFYTLFRDARNFQDPEKFIPERWTTQRHLVRNADVFAPFLLGSYNCLGKSLALMQVRHVVVELLRRYNMRLAPATDPNQYWASRTDGFVMGLGPLELIFEDRRDSKSY